MQLYEKVMRCLVLTTEKRPQELIEQDIKGLPKDDIPVEGAPEPEDREDRGDRRRRSLSEEPGMPGFDAAAERATAADNPPADRAP